MFLLIAKGYSTNLLQVNLWYRKYIIYTILINHIYEKHVSTKKILWTNKCVGDVLESLHWETCTFCDMKIWQLIEDIIVKHVIQWIDASLERLEARFQDRFDNYGELFNYLAKKVVLIEKKTKTKLWNENGKDIIFNNINYFLHN
jgi:hypothetical protein